MAKADGNFDGGRFRPRIGGRGGEIRGGRLPTFRATILRRLAANGMRKPTVGRGIGSRTITPYVRDPPAYSRRCVIKARFVKMNAHGAQAARQHLAYIERDGVERDGSKGRMFDATNDIDRKTFAEQLEGEKRQFRFIVSPEDATELDLRRYTRDLMTRMEKDLGRDLRWAAVAHHNTDNPHVHIVVRGIDRDGDQVLIPAAYMARDMRLRAQEIATRDLGPRTGLELERQLGKEISQERFTSLDRRVADLVGPDRTLDLSQTPPATNGSHAHVVGRMMTLERMGLAERTSATSWELTEGWERSLQDLGERGDIIKRMHRAIGDARQPWRIYEPDPAAEPIEGVVKHKGLHDEDRGDFFAVVQTEGGAVYVRMDEHTGKDVQEGERVRVSAVADTWLKQPDHAIAGVAAANAGIYDPAKHVEQLRGSAGATEDGRYVSAEELVKANVRRLERLERYNLVRRGGDGTWHVPADLVHQLRDRERTHPRQRLEVQRLGLDRGRGRDLGR